MASYEIALSDDPFKFGIIQDASVQILTDLRKINSESVCSVKHKFRTYVF